MRESGLVLPTASQRGAIQNPDTREPYLLAFSRSWRGRVVASRLGTGDLDLSSKEATRRQLDVDPAPPFSG